MNATVTTEPALDALVPQVEIPRVYGRIAWFYDAWAWLTESRARRLVGERARVRDGEALLEIAVGTGLVFADLAARNRSGRNVGIDLTPAMLARARRRAERLGLKVELAVGDAFRLGHPDATFDLVVNNYMFDLLPERDFGRVLAEMRRALRPGGRLLLVNMAKGARLHHRLYEALYRIRPSLMGGCRGVSLAGHVAAAGFVEVEREYLSQLGFPTEVVTARVAPSSGDLPQG